MNKFINVVDENLCNALLSHNFKLLNTINSTDLKVWTFEYEPRFFNLFENKEVLNKCFISNTFKMTF